MQEPMFRYFVYKCYLGGQTNHIAIITFWSTHVNNSQRHNAQIENELLAIVMGCETFFTIFTFNHLLRLKMTNLSMMLSTNL